MELFIIIYQKYEKDRKINLMFFFIPNKGIQILVQKYKNYKKNEHFIKGT